MKNTRPKITPSMGALIPVIDWDTGDVTMMDDGSGDYGTTDAWGATTYGAPSNFYTGVGDPNPQPLPDQYISPGVGYDQQTIEDAARSTQVGQTKTIRTSDGRTFTVKGVADAASLPNIPDMNTLYRIGTALFRPTGQVNAQGRATYTQAQIGGNNVMMYGTIGLLAYMLLDDKPKRNRK